MISRIIPLNLSVISQFILLLSLSGLLLACDGNKPSSSHAPSLKENNQEVDGNATKRNENNNSSDHKNKSQDTQTTHADGTLTMVMLGDSLTAGFGLQDAQALPKQIESALKEAGLDVTVINAGVSGDTTSGGLARFDWSVRSAQPDLLVIALGANDYLNGSSASQAKDNLEKIIMQAQDAKIPTALVGVAARSDKKLNEYDEAYSAIYPSLAVQYKLPLYPAMLKDVRDNPALLQSDGLHPTAKGTKIVADNLTQFLIPIIENLK